METIIICGLFVWLIMTFPLWMYPTYLVLDATLDWNCILSTWVTILTLFLFISIDISVYALLTELLI